MGNVGTWYDEHSDFPGVDMVTVTAWHNDMLAGRMSMIAFERRRLFGLEEAEKLEARDRASRKAARQAKEQRISDQSTN